MNNLIGIAIFKEKPVLFLDFLEFSFMRDFKELKKLKKKLRPGIFTQCFSKNYLSIEICGFTCIFILQKKDQSLVNKLESILKEELKENINNSNEFHFKKKIVSKIQNELKEEQPIIQNYSSVNGDLSEVKDLANHLRRSAIQTNSRKENPSEHDAKSYAISQMENQ